MVSDCRRCGAYAATQRSNLDTISSLAKELSALRAAVRAADAAFDLIFDGADGTEAHDAYREARAKCGDVT